MATARLRAADKKLRAAERLAAHRRASTQASGDEQRDAAVAGEAEARPTCGVRLASKQLWRAEANVAACAARLSAAELFSICSFYMLHRNR